MWLSVSSRWHYDCTYLLLKYSRAVRTFTFTFTEMSPVTTAPLEAVSLRPLFNTKTPLSRSQDSSDPFEMGCSSIYCPFQWAVGSSNGQAMLLDILLWTLTHPIQKHNVSLSAWQGYKKVLHSGNVKYDANVAICDITQHTAFTKARKQQEVWRSHWVEGCMYNIQSGPCVQCKAKLGGKTPHPNPSQFQNLTTQTLHLNVTNVQTFD